MIEILVPDIHTTRQLQAAQNRYYWSRTVDALFRREGVMSIHRRTVPSADASAVVVCRDYEAPVFSANIPHVFEGPLSQEQLASFGLSARPLPEVQVLTLDGNPSLAVCLPQIQIRGPGKSVQPLPLPPDSKWRNQPLLVQFLQGDGWTPVLQAYDRDSGEEGALAVRRGCDMVIGCALFDLLARWTAVPPLASPYAGFSRTVRHDLVGPRIVQLVVEHIVGAGAAPPLMMERWPSGRRAALTVRHDYDRQAPATNIHELLRLYDERSLKASVGFLPYFLETAAMAAFQSGRHEVQAHVASASRVEFREDLRLLRQASASAVSGVTIHGGPQGIGFRGQTHFDWFDDSGVAYCEAFGMRDTIPQPVCRLFDDVPDVSGLLATPGHFSLDGSTAPDDHRLDALRATVPASLARGNHTIVMNHPDIHVSQLCDLLAGLSLDGVWCAPSSDVVQWHRVTRYESQVRRHAAGYEIRFPQPLPHAASVRVGAVVHELSSGCIEAVVPIGTNLQSLPSYATS